MAMITVAPCCLLAALLLMSPLVPVLAGSGAGGTTSGTHTYGGDFSNYNLGANTIGGFGYGVTDGASRIGGFGLAILTEAPRRLVGGFGGTITGKELDLGRLNFGVTAWTGVDGISADLQGGRGGYFAFFAELDIEIGFSILPFMQLVGYGGYQIIGSILPGFAPEEALSYTPVAGLRLAWGDF